MLLLQADQILIFFFSHFSNHSEGPGSFTQGMGNERLGEAEDGEGRREGVGLPAPAVLREEKDLYQQEDGDSREGIFSLRVRPSAFPPGIPALTLGMPRVHCRWSSGRVGRAGLGREDPEGVATAGAWRNLARGSGF